MLGCLLASYARTSDWIETPKSSICSCSNCIWSPITTATVFFVQQLLNHQKWVANATEPRFLRALLA